MSSDCSDMKCCMYININMNKSNYKKEKLGGKLK